MVPTVTVMPASLMIAVSRSVGTTPMEPSVWFVQFAPVPQLPLLVADHV